jgi:hypothetical protein
LASIGLCDCKCWLSIYIIGAYTLCICYGNVVCTYYVFPSGVEVIFHLYLFFKIKSRHTSETSAPTPYLLLRLIDLEAIDRCICLCKKHISNWIVSNVSMKSAFIWWCLLVDFLSSECI